MKAWPGGEESGWVSWCLNIFIVSHYSWRGGLAEPWCIRDLIAHLMGLRPALSAVCDDKWRDKSYELHRQRLRAIKPAVDNRTPPVYPHLYQKLKKAQMEEGAFGVGGEPRR